MHIGKLQFSGNWPAFPTLHGFVCRVSCFDSVALLLSCLLLVLLHRGKDSVSVQSCCPGTAWSVHCGLSGLRPGMVVEERRLLRKWAQSSSASKTLLEQNTADDTSTAYGNVEKRGWESEELGPLRGCFDLYLWAGRCSETKRRH